MIKLIEDDNKIKMISDFVTSVIEKNKDFRAFNSAYISCAQGIDLSITLKLITIGPNYKPTYSEKELEELYLKTGYYVKVESMLFNDFENEHLSNGFYYPERAMLKYGRIVYDRDGRLTKLKNEYRVDSKIDDLEWRGLVDIDENSKTQTNCMQQEQSGPVKKLTPPKQNNQ